MTEHNPSSDPRSNGAVARLLHALELDRADEAVRELLQALTANEIPASGDVVGWLARRIGKERTLQLVQAMVRFPCFGCRDGRQPCDACESSGSIAGVPCDTCLGTRLERCDFCNGSGLMAINSVPDAFKLAIIRFRLEAAGKRIRHLLGEPLPGASQGEPAEAVKRARLLLLQVDRSIGVVENMLMVAEHLQDEEARRGLRPALAGAARIAMRGEERLCELVQVMARAYLRRADRVQDEEAREHCLRAARYYESLVSPERSLTGSGLTHPFLHQIIKANHAGNSGTPATQ